MSIGQITSGVQSGTAALTSVTAITGLLIATPQTTIGYSPQSTNIFGGLTGNPAPSLVFHYEGEQTVNCQSDITDHYIEDNTAIQDNITLKPELITTHGFIGDVNNVPPNKILSLAQQAAYALLSVEAYVPQLTATAILAYNEATFLAETALNAANAAVAGLNSIAGNNGESVIDGNSLSLAANQSPQQTYFQQFYAYWRTRTLFTVQTPWAVFQNCAIQSLRAIQDETTRTITDFEVTFKLLRFAESDSVTSETIGSLSGRAQNQNDFLVNIGTSIPTPSTALNAAVNGLF